MIHGGVISCADLLDLEHAERSARGRSSAAAAPSDADKGARESQNTAENRPLAARLARAGSGDGTPARLERAALGGRRARGAIDGSRCPKGRSLIE